MSEIEKITALFRSGNVTNVHDCPAGFSPPLAHFAICLNQNMPLALRRELLLPLIPQLEETADTPERERGRVQFIVLETTRRIIASLSRERLMSPRLVRKCEQVRTLAECMDANAGLIRAGLMAIGGVGYAGLVAASFARHGNDFSAVGASVAACGQLSRNSEARNVFALATEILSEAIVTHHPAEAIIPRPQVSNVRVVESSLKTIWNARIANAWLN
jgi:hypothetical protein